MVLDTDVLPKSLTRLIQTAKVKVNEVRGEIILTPIYETKNDCPILGMFADGRISVDKFLLMKYSEKEMEA